jgi:hypothetical protein
MPYKREVQTLTRARLRELVDINLHTGWVTWKIPRQGVRVGDRAGSVGNRGYRVICLDHVRYLEQHLVWFYAHGYWPRNQLDHINRVRADNRLCNLRAATRSQNYANSGVRCTNKLGVKGVRQVGKKFMAELGQKGRWYYLGMHDTIEGAIAAHAAKHRELYGKFSPASP